MTEPDQTRHRLSAAQETALNALLSGAPQHEAAALSGVARTTVTNWANHHIPFIREMNRRRNELNRQVDVHATSVALRALDAVDRAIGDGDPHLALRYLQTLGLPRFVNSTTSRPESPVAVSAALGHALNSDMLDDAMVPEIAALLVDELSSEIID